MVNTEYANAYSEVLEILKYIPLEDYRKIPKSQIKLFEDNANHDYVFTYNPDNTLEEQNVSKIARGIIAILFRDYWATEIQKNKIMAKQNYDRQRWEEEKIQQYKTDEFFKNHKENISQGMKENQALVEIKNEKWYEKIFSFLHRIFKR